MIRVFTQRTSHTPDDNLVFIGHPPLFLPPEQPVKISVVFTWEIPLALMLQKSWSAIYKDVEIGGPAFGDPGGEFTPGLFVKKGVTYTSRGCVRKCGFCYVPKREKGIRQLEIKDGHILQDNNILACGDKHIDDVFDMLRRQKRAITFGGGLDARLFNSYHGQLFDSIKIKEMWFACDHKRGLKPLANVSQILADYPMYKKKCYVLLRYDKAETLKEAEDRLKRVFHLGFEPFAQLYQPDKQIIYSKEWRDLQRTWSRPAAFKSKMKKEEKGGN